MSQLTHDNFLNWCNSQDRHSLVMGIVNVTPDSFSDGGHYLNSKLAVRHALQLIEDGADILDIGGESSRPGATPLSEQEELDRVLPVIQGIREQNNSIPISIDTYKSVVAKKAINVGATFVNDISGFKMDSNMVSTVAELNVPVVLMHMNGTPQTMQKNLKYDNLIQDITSFFRHQIQKGKDAGISNDKFILDPGIGFGKTIEHNFSLIQHLNEFCNLGYPILVGPSRKTFIGTTLNLPVLERLEGTAAAVSASILNGARILRVHDVKEMKRVVTITEKIRTAA